MTLREWLTQNNYGSRLDPTTNILTIRRGKRRLDLSIDALESFSDKGLDAPLAEVSDVMAAIQAQIDAPVEAHDSVESGLRQRHDS